MKAIWSGSLTFGLINIPIKVYPASDEHALDLHMLHKKDLSPIRFARICKEEEKEIPYSDIVKGFEYEKGEFIVVEEDDFKAANVKKTSTIEIQHFSELREIDPIYFQKPYYLEADRKSGKAYQLLCRALGKSDKVAIAHFVFRQREHLGAIASSGDRLVLLEMRFHGEVRSPKELYQPAEKTSNKELQVAVALIDQLTKPFQPEKHHDTYTEELLQLIKQKAKGKKRARPKEKKPTASREAKDLMGLLQASMKQGPRKTPARKRAP